MEERYLTAGNSHWMMSFMNNNNNKKIIFYCIEPLKFRNLFDRVAHIILTHTKYNKAPHDFLMIRTNIKYLHTKRGTITVQKSELKALFER